jgi:hypothetical protein
VRVRGQREVFDKTLTVCSNKFTNLLERLLTHFILMDDLIMLTSNIGMHTPGLT